MTLSREISTYSGNLTEEQRRYWRDKAKDLEDDLLATSAKVLEATRSVRTALERDDSEDEQRMAMKDALFALTGQLWSGW